ncbi:MAG: hypothetical protein ACSLEW_08130 [Nocardioides sp.]
MTTSIGPVVAGLRIGASVGAATIIGSVVLCVAFIPSDDWLSSRLPVAVDLSLIDRVRMGLGMAAMTFGADARSSVAGSGDLASVQVSLGAVPVTVLLIALAVAVGGFLRATASRHRTIREQAVVATAAAASAGGLIGLAAWPARFTVDVATLDPRALGDLGLLSSGLSDVEVSLPPVQAALHAGLAVLAGLGLALAVRRWLPVAGRSLTVLVWSLPVVGALSVLTVLATAGHHGQDLQLWRLYALGLLGWGANLGLWSTAVGQGGRLGGSASGSEELVAVLPGHETSWWERLPGVIGDWDVPWGLWIAVILAPLVFWAMSRRLVRSSTPERYAADFAALLGAVAVLAPALVWLSGIHLRVGVEAALYGRLDARLDGGTALVETTLFAIGWLAVIGTVALISVVPRTGPSTPRSPQGSEEEPPTG